jgi:membrane-bound ClpP family serine protease
VLAAIITIWGFRSKSWERFSLKSSIDSKVNDEDIMNLQVGQRGITLSSCRPMGKAEFDNRNWEVRTNGGYLEAGTEVQIIRIENRTITIEPLT